MFWCHNEEEFTGCTKIIFESCESQYMSVFIKTIKRGFLKDICKAWYFVYSIFLYHPQNTRLIYGHNRQRMMDSYGALAAQHWYPLSNTRENEQYGFGMAIPLFVTAHADSWSQFVQFVFWQPHSENNSWMRGGWKFILKCAIHLSAYSYPTGISLLQTFPKFCNI